MATTDQIEMGRICNAVGFCLAQFSKTEESLAALYGVAAGVPKIEIAFRTHEEIREFQYRLAATDAVVRLWLQSIKDDASRTEAETEWNALNHIIKDDSKTRNQLAHFTLGSETNKDGGEAYYALPYFQIFSYGRDAFAESKLPPGVRKFDIDTLGAKCERFSRNTDRIDAFISRLISLGARLPEWS